MEVEVLHSVHYLSLPESHVELQTDTPAGKEDGHTRLSIVLDTCIQLDVDGNEVATGRVVLALSVRQMASIIVQFFSGVTHDQGTFYAQLLRRLLHYRWSVMTNDHKKSIMEDDSLIPYDTLITSKIA